LFAFHSIFSKSKSLLDGEFLFLFVQLLAVRLGPRASEASEPLSRLRFLAASFDVPRSSCRREVVLTIVLNKSKKNYISRRYPIVLRHMRCFHEFSILSIPYFLTIDESISRIHQAPNYVFAGQRLIASALQLVIASALQLFKRLGMSESLFGLHVRSFEICFGRHASSPCEIL